MSLSTRIRNGEFHEYSDGQSCDDPTDVNTDAIADEVAELEKKYNELLYEVAKKFPDESRHETAKRYIKEREDSACSAEPAQDAPPFRGRPLPQ
jgi:hypothetical protein